MIVEKLKKPIGHASLEKRKVVGAHYTPKILSDFVAQKILKFWTPKPDMDKVRILDPAVGAGELLLSTLEELTRSGFSNIECVLGHSLNRQMYNQQEILGGQRLQL